MHLLLRRIRGIVLMGLTWAIGWAIAGAILVAAQVFWSMRFEPSVPAIANVAAVSALFFAVYGFAIGALFAIVLAVGERRRTLGQLNAWRIAAWGAVAGAIVPLLNLLTVVSAGRVMPASAVPVTIAGGLLGAASAAGTLRIARAGAGSDRDRLPPASAGPGIRATR